MKCSQLPRMRGDTHLGARYYHWLTLLWDKGKHSVAAKSQIGTPLGIAVEGPFYPFLVDFPGGERLWGNINPLSAHTYVDARFVGNWYGVSVWNGIFRPLQLSVSEFWVPIGCKFNGYQCNQTWRKRSLLLECCVMMPVE